MKLPRDLSGHQIARALRRLGFIEERQEGSHIRLSRADLRVTVPNHSSIAPKTLQSILKQAQITIEQLKAEL